MSRLRAALARGVSRWRGTVVLLGVSAAATALSMAGCEAVPLTASPGTSIQLVANPDFVIAHGGVSVVTAILVEPAGTFSPDGTEVFFFTNLGRVDVSGKTRNGVAAVNFVSDSRSGVATVTAVSGGPAPATSPTAGPSPTPTPGGSTGPSVDDVGPGAPPPVASTLDIAAAQNSATVTIRIGTAIPHRVAVTADSQRLISPASTRITATVFDTQGNPIQNVPVSFSFSSSEQTIEESLDSGGAFQYTNANGQVFDTLRTRAPVGLGQKVVTVRATTSTGTSGDVNVFIE